MKFSETKSVYGYLNDRYKKKIYGKTMGEESEIVRLLVSDHSFEDLKKMKRRLESTLSVNEKAMSLTSQPFSIISTFITIFISVTLSMVTVMITLTANLWGGNKIATNAEMKSLLDGVSPIFNLIIKISTILVLVALGIWLLYYYHAKKKLARYNNATLLVNEAIESYPHWKK